MSDFQFMEKMGFWAMVIKTKVVNIVFTKINFVRYRCFLECQKNLMTLTFGGCGESKKGWAKTKL